MTRLDLPLDAVGLARRYRIGPASRPLDDPAQRDVDVTFGGIGLRPYRPVHLRATAQGGDLAVTWLRRTRWGGDGWTGVEVPLFEDRETYVLRVTKDGAVLREVVRDTPLWTYSAADQASDGAGDSFTLSVAQVSATYGAGPFATLQVGA